VCCSLGAGSVFFTLPLLASFSLRVKLSCGYTVNQW
jgi:hypothetical protein